MLEQYFKQPSTVDRIRSAWLGASIERYVIQLHKQGYSARTVHRRVPVLIQFSEFLEAKNATSWEALPAHVAGFVDHYLESHSDPSDEVSRQDRIRYARNPVQQLLGLILPDYVPESSRGLPQPFSDQAPGFFEFLLDERGLSPVTVRIITHHIRRFEKYLQRIELLDVSALSPAVISAFMTDSSSDLGKGSLRVLSSHLRAFLDYLFQQGLTLRNLSEAVEAPTHYRLSKVPRSITWDEVRKLLESVDRRDAIGKRDYAILMLLVTYGLRAREVAALTLDDIDWQHERLGVAARKAGHCTAYPLSSMVGEAIIDYIERARPATTERRLFFRSQVPYKPVHWAIVSQMVGRRLTRAGIQVRRPGSHTLRHACAQHLLDAHFDLKAIGDYIGHGSPASTEIYTKVDIDALRDLALSEGERLL